MSLVQLFNRQERAFRDFSAINRTHMEASRTTSWPMRSTTRRWSF